MSHLVLDLGLFILMALSPAVCKNEKVKAVDLSLNIIFTASNYF